MSSQALHSSNVHPYRPSCASQLEKCKKYNEADKGDQEEEETALCHHTQRRIVTVNGTVALTIRNTQLPSYLLQLNHEPPGHLSCW